MRTILRTILILLFTAQSQAEVFIGPTTSSNRLIVASGEGIIITEIVSNDSNLATLIVGGVTNSVQFGPFFDSGQGPYALKGVCELLLTDARAVRFQRIPGDSLHTEIVSPGSSFELNILQSKTAKFFPTSVDRIHNITLSNYTGGIVTNVTSTHPEFDGPLWIKIQNNNLDPLIVSYYLIDTALAQPAFGYISIPPGSAEIAVEKSIDLTNWVTSITKVVNSDTAAHFRLRIRK